MPRKKGPSKANIKFKMSKKGTCTYKVKIIKPGFALKVLKVPRANKFIYLQNELTIVKLRVPLGFLGEIWSVLISYLS